MQHEKYFPWKTIRKMWWRNYSQTLFWRIKIEHTSESIVLKFYKFCFYWGLSKYSETKLLTTCFFTLSKAFLKSKKGSETSLLNSFSLWFLKKNISVIFYELTKFHCLVAFNSSDIDQYVYCNHLLTRLWRHKFRN